MQNRCLHTISYWSLLLIIGSSITLSTLHTHHQYRWNETHGELSQTHSHGQSISENTNVCPVCGYLYNAQPSPLQQSATAFAAIGLTHEEAQPTYLPSFAAPVTGRSPPQ